MKRIAFLLIAIVGVASFAFAEEPAPRLEVKKKSAFKPEADRNPFWPIGWKPAKAVASTEAEHGGGDITPSAFMLTSVTIEKGARFAIINGKIIQEGQQFALQMGTSTYQLTLKQIQDGQVVLSRRDEEIIVPLRRK